MRCEECHRLPEGVKCFNCKEAWIEFQEAHEKRESRFAKILPPLPFYPRDYNECPQCLICHTWYNYGYPQEKSAFCSAPCAKEYIREKGLTV